MNKIKFKLSFIFNIAVIAVCVGLIIYFVFSENGLRDLLKGSNGITWIWLVRALACHIGNAAIDCLLTWQCTKAKYKMFTFWQGVKIAVTGHFFSAVTPGSSGGQPMQLYRLRRMGVDVGFASSMLLQKFLIYQITSTIYTIILFITKKRFLMSLMRDGVTIGFVIAGFAMQLSFTAAVILASLKPKWLKMLVRLCMPAIVKFKGRHTAEGWVRKIDSKINVFRKSNREFFKKPLHIALYTAEVAVQITLINSVPYFVYKSLMPQGGGRWFTMLCAVALVSVVSSTLPIPGASGISELAFSVFFGAFFTSTTIKSATLIWRSITFYFTILAEGPLSVMGKTNADRLSRKEVREVIRSSDNNREK